MISQTLLDGTTPYPYGGGMLGAMKGANGMIGPGAGVGTGVYGMNGRYSEDRRYDSSRSTTATTLTGIFDSKDYDELK